MRVRTFKLTRSVETNHGVVLHTGDILTAIDDLSEDSEKYYSQEHGDISHCLNCTTIDYMVVHGYVDRV